MLARTEGLWLVEDETITEAERLALIELRDRLQRGEIKKIGYEIDNDKPPELIFAMHTWYTKHSCGTIGCIRGLCWAISGGKAFPGIDLESGTATVTNKRLMKLFLPDHQFERTPAEAAHAITTFLATGEAEWAEL